MRTFAPMAIGLCVLIQVSSFAQTTVTQPTVEDSALVGEAYRQAEATKNGHIKVTVHIANNGNVQDPSFWASWEIKRFSMGAEYGSAALEKVDKQKITGALCLDNADCGNIKLTVWRDGFDGVDRTYVYDIPGAGMHLEGGAQVYEETVALEKTPRASKTLQEFNCRLSSNSDGSAKASAFALDQSAGAPRPTPKKPVTIALPGELPTSASAILQVRVVDTTETVPRALDSDGRVTYPANAEIRLVWVGDVDAGFAVADVPRKTAIRSFSEHERMPDAPAQGYLPYLVPPRESFAPAPDSVPALPYPFYCRIGGLYGFGALTYAFCEDGKIDVAIHIVVQTDGSRAFAVKE